MVGEGRREGGKEGGREGGRERLLWERETAVRIRHRRHVLSSSSSCETVSNDPDKMAAALPLQPFHKFPESN